MVQRSSERKAARAKGAAVLVVASTLIGLPALAQDGDWLPDFSEAAGYTLRLGADVSRQRRSETDVDAALATFLPKITASAEWSMAGDRAYHPGAIYSASPGSFPQKDPSILALEASLTVFDGGRRTNMLRAAQAMAAAGRATSLDIRQQLFLDAADAALAVIRDRAIVASRRDSVARQRQTLDATRARLIDQTTTLTDVAIAAAQVDQAEAGLAGARGDLEASEIAFHKLLGHAPATRMSLSVPEARLPRTAAIAAERAERGAPAITAAHLTSKAAQFKADAARSAYYPTVELVGRANTVYNQTRDLDEVDGYAGLLRMRMPIFDPTLRPAVAVAVAEVEQSRFAIASVRLEAASAARTGFAARQSAMAQSAQLAQQIANARKAVKGMEIERELGTRLLTDILSAQASLAEAEIVAARLRYLRDRSAFALLAAMGELQQDDAPQPLATRSAAAAF